MIVLVNFNTYLGGGETLFVRFALYLHRNNIDYLAICKSDSFIFKELNRHHISSEKLIRIESNVDYYYLSKRNRRLLVEEIDKYLPRNNDLRFLTFCMRDLYTIVDLNNGTRGSISHLILHNQDYLYVCQTIVDKMRYKLKCERRFSAVKSKTFNRYLFNCVNNHRGMIPMSLIITKMWRKELRIIMSESSIVPVPCINKNNNSILIKGENEKKILWIGRLVDFKLSSLYVILNFIKRRSDYTLSIIGDGNKAIVDKYIEDNQIPKENIRFLGQIRYDDLKDVILKHSIGYASGSSIIEIAKYGLPVIMALQDNKHILFKRDICGGLFCNTTKGNFAEDLCIYKESEISITIDDVISEIEADYHGCAQKFYDYTVAEYDEDTNFAQYVRLIESTESFTEKILVPQASIIRRYIYNRLK